MALELVQPVRKYDTANLRRIISPWNSGFVPYYTYAGAKSILIQHAQGQFMGSSQLMDKLGEDDDIPGVIEKRVNATLKAPFSVDSGDETIDTVVLKLFSQICPYGELYNFLKTYVLLGVAVGTLDWNTDGQWLPRFRCLPSQFLRYDESTNQYFYSTREGEVLVQPGDAKWVMLTKTDRGFLDGAIRALTQLWLMKSFNNVYWSRFNEKHGNPIIQANIPFGAEQKDKDSFIDSIRNLGSEGVIGSPVGLGEDSDVNFAIELIEAESTQHASFKDLSEYCSRKIQVMLLGNNIGTEVASTGSNRAAAETAAKGLDALKATVDAQILGECLQSQVLAPIIAFNYGQAEIPFPKWDLLPPEDTAQKSAGLKSVADMITSLKSAGKRLSVDSLNAIAKSYNVTFEDIEAKSPPTNVQDTPNLVEDINPME